MKTSNTQKYVIKELPGKVAIVRMKPDDQIPAWAWSGEISAVVKTADELSIVCDESVVPLEVQAEKNWSVFKLEGPIPFTQTGVLASLLNPIAEASIGIFAISTYDTDYILVKVNDIDSVKAILRSNGHTIL